jgi:UDP-N-acetylmuramate dehydrogenase
MAVHPQAALSAYTTLGLGGPAGRLVEADSDDQIVSAVRAADQAGEPVLVLGGGSNLVVGDDGFPGTVVRIASRGVTTGTVPDDATGRDVGADGAEAVTVTVAAGESWDGLVEWSVAEGLAGLECLSGIPGLAGATPIQNVGAYGQEVAQTITAVRAYDRQSGQVVELGSAQCEFGYRTSMFKRAAAGQATGRFVVLAVTFRLRRQPLSVPVAYAELARRLDVAPGDQVPLAQAREAVLALRRGKGMVLDPADPDSRSAGSFFTNPVLSTAQFAALEQRARAGSNGRADGGSGSSADGGSGAAVPSFPASRGTVKVPAAWLIEHAGFGKGYPGAGPVRISTKHTLALTHPGGGSTADLLALAREITTGVRAAFDVELTNEPVFVGVVL